MKSNPITNSSADTLARVMDLGSQATLDWPPQELAAVLDHQLSAALTFDLCRLQGVSDEKVRSLSLNQEPPIHTFRDLLTHPHPPVELLGLAKEFAKTNQQHPDRLLPQEIASIIYYASIATASIRCQQSLTSLDQKSLRCGYQWSLGQLWIGDTLWALFREALQAIER